jgi:glycosyltransferase involved in cell wall biosynthesis
MKIVHVIWTQFPIEAYGGTERVCYWLAKAQAEMGHDVTVLCKPGSKLSFAKTLELPDSISELDSLLPKGTEILQLYGTPKYQIRSPYLVNIGGNGEPGEEFSPNTVFVSKNHAERHGWTEFVYNGIDLSEYPLRVKKENYLLFLAKASWRVKNLKGAIKIARKANVPLEIAGGSAPFWQKWRGGVHSNGMVGGAKKLELLQGAKALLFPVLWNEPFGLAVIESLACGTPVIATPRGSLPEIVDSTCGRLEDSISGLVRAVEELKFDPHRCRARVENKFTHMHMAEKYLFYYKKILSEGKLREGFPVTPIDVDPEEKFSLKKIEAPND